MNTASLSDEQIADYHENGFSIVRGVLSPDETRQLREVVEGQAPDHSYPSGLKYPEPAKYTISGNKMGVHPGLAPIAEHPAIIDAVECLPGQRAHLTAYVAYVRAPGDKGSAKIMTITVGVQWAHQ